MIIKMNKQKCRTFFQPYCLTFFERLILWSDRLGSHPGSATTSWVTSGESAYVCLSFLLCRMEIDDHSNLGTGLRWWLVSWDM